jgi:hypothetical protein
VKLNGALQFLIYVDNIFGKNINAIDTEAQLDASKEVGREVNAEKMKHMLIQDKTITQRELIDPLTTRLRTKIFVNDINKSALNS